METVEIDRTTAIALTHDFCDLFAFFDLTVCIQPYREEPEYCYICKRKLSGYNYTGKCYHHGPEPIVDEIERTTKYEGDPCIKCGSTLRYPTGKCVACQRAISRRQQERIEARRAA
jgi:hypothetical protein